MSSSNILNLKSSPKNSKGGAKAGQTYRKPVDRPTWFRLCQNYQSKHSNLKPYKFLKSYQDEIQYTETNRKQFVQKLEEYKVGKLQADDMGSRHRPGKFCELEKKLVDWVVLRRHLYQKHKVGVNWMAIKVKLEFWLHQILGVVNLRGYFVGWGNCQIVKRAKKNF
jgi:hypothetical protein